MGDVRLGIVTVNPLDTRARNAVQLAAEVGLDHIGSGDHICFRGWQGTDGLVTAAMLAGMHPTLDLYVGVYLLALRHPLLVARQLSTLAHVAPGRLVFGIGVGGEDPHEFASCGVDMKTRGRRTNESLALLRRLLAGESVTFSGEFFQLEDTQVLPAPHPPIPLVVGGRSDAAIRRAGTFGDGWIGAFNSPRRFTEAVDLAAATAAAAGRKKVAWRHGMAIWCGFGADTERAKQRLAIAMEEFYGVPFERFERYCPFGSPERVAETLAAYVEAGCETFSLIPVAASIEEGVHGSASVKRLLAGSMLSVAG